MKKNQRERERERERERAYTHGENPKIIERLKTTVTEISH